MESFSKAPESIKEFINKYGGRLKNVVDSPWLIDEKTGKQYKISCYIPKKIIIEMDERMDNNTYKITFRHEYGHYIDNIINNYSENNEYNHSFQMDKKSFDNANDEGSANLNAMLQALSESKLVFESRYVSDILSALTMNDTKVRQFYKKNNKVFYGHKDEYWCERKNVDKKEIYANLFAIYSENNEVITSFVERWFPNLTRQFQVSIKSINFDKVLI